MTTERGYVSRLLGALELNHVGSLFLGVFCYIREESSAQSQDTDQRLLQSKLPNGHKQVNVSKYGGAAGQQSPRTDCVSKPMTAHKQASDLGCVILCQIHRHCWTEGQNFRI